jgi:hypothetical protein
MNSPTDYLIKHNISTFDYDAYEASFTHSLGRCNDRLAFYFHHRQKNVSILEEDEDQMIFVLPLDNQERSKFNIKWDVCYLYVPHDESKPIIAQSFLG